MKEIEEFKKLMEAIDTPYQEIGEGDVFGRSPEHYELAIGSEGVSIVTHGGEPVIEMSVDEWIGLVSQFNRNYRP